MNVMRTPEKTNSVPNLTALDTSSPDCFVNTRLKRKRSDEDLNSQLEQIKSVMSIEMKSLFKKMTEKQNEQTNTILASLKDIQQTNAYFQSTITFLCEENSALKQKIQQLETHNKADREQITILENKLEENQKADRKSNIEIKNVPFKGEERKNDILEMVKKLTETLSLKFDKNDVKDVIKINKNKNQNNGTIIVEFTNTFIKSDILKAAKTYNNKYKSNKLSAKHLGINSNPETPIYISENLTPKASRLFFLARDLKTTKNYKYCWTNYGKVYLRLDDTSPIVTITSESQIQQLVNK